MGARPGEAVPNLMPAEGPTGVLHVPVRHLLGPGPANADPRVLAAQSLPLLGHMHPPFIKIMDEIQQGLRYLFQTKSKYVCLISASGHGGLEACIANLLEPGETVVVGTHGIWGQRAADVADRYGAKVVNLETVLGETLSYQQIKEAIEMHKPAVLFLCQGDSSTGVHQNLAGLGDLCHANGTLLLVDTVCSLGGVPFFADEWKIDAMYSGSQKVLGAPPGAAPLFFSDCAVAKLQARKTKVASYYFDLNLVGSYWGWFGDKRPYHHTGLVSNWYGLREALALVVEEGLESMWARHKTASEDLWAGLREMGLEPFPEKLEDRLATVNTIKIPKDVDGIALVANAMNKFNVELAGGLGPSAGLCWRVGLLGYNCRAENVALILEAFRDGLRKQGKLPSPAIANGKH